MEVPAEEVAWIRRLFLIFVTAPIIYAAVSAIFVLEFADPRTLFQIKELPPFTDENMFLYAILAIAVSDMMIAVPIADFMIKSGHRPSSAFMTSLALLEGAGILGMLEVFMTTLLLEEVGEPSFFVVTGFSLIGASMVLMILLYISVMIRVSKSPATETA